ncbi:hypothetical protein [Empedobacter falsenii]
MLSSANLNIEGALISLVLMLFFGSGILYTTLALIVNTIQNKPKKSTYYFVTFLISGIIGLFVSAVILIIVWTKTEI